MAQAVRLLLIITTLAVGLARPQPLYAAMNRGQVDLIRVPANASDPRLVQGVIERWEAARAELADEIGYDWLAVEASDIMRPVDFIPTASNQILYSWHKTGRAVDVPQSGFGLRHVQEGAYERLYVNNVDVTAIMEANGFHRIPSNPSRPEWWHYEDRSDILTGQSLGWQGAMSQVYPIERLEQVYPELDWQNFNCFGDDPYEPGDDNPTPERGGIPIEMEMIPDLVGYVSFEITPSPDWWPMTDAPERPDSAIDVAGWLRYGFIWLAWSIRELTREGVYFLINMLQIVANWAATGVNLVLSAFNGLWRFGVWVWLNAKAMFLAGWLAFEVIRSYIHEQIGRGLLVVQVAIQFVVNLLRTALEAVGSLLTLILSLGKTLLGLLGWIGGLLLGVLTSIRLRLSATTLPPQLVGSSPLYDVVHGFGRGLRDSQVGWLLFLAWAMAYIAFILFAMKWFRKGSTA